MNRKSIAGVEQDADGAWVWKPTPKIAALGLKPIKLGKASGQFDPDKLGTYDDDNGELRGLILNLNASARALARKDKQDRKAAIEARRRCAMADARMEADNGNKRGRPGRQPLDTDAKALRAWQNDGRFALI